ncbi:hypothetical protein [Pseudomonas putida]|uniref:hypothetical protein n=1 Tax=Pseudomonas putida TaxID=303 RepID=UPI001048AAAB|nr:hypothetical protein [Pseudomonas putida]MDG9816516.1 hypothetical protein [Pseudomonas putida]
MTDKVQWKTLPTKANREMEQAGAKAAGEFFRRTGSNNLWVIYEAMVAAAPPAPAERHKNVPDAWSSVKPASAGAFWIRGNGLSRPALMEVAEEDGELRCNLHDRTTCGDFGYGYSIEQLSENFEFSGPLHVYAEPGATVERDERAAFEAAWREVHKHEGKSPFLRIDPLGNYRWGDVHEGWLMWQARAALEAKP